MTQTPTTANTPTTRPDGLDPNHFTLLRIAKLRNLKARCIGEGVYAVPSHTRKKDGIEWVVTLTTCGCPSRGYCTHLSAAVDFHFINEASPTDYGRYTGELIADRTHLRHRIRAGELTRNDKIYLAYCERFYRDKLAKAAVKVPPVVETTVRQGNRTRTLTTCGPFVI